MIAKSSPRCYVRAVRHFASTRGPEVLVLQASPFLGALFGNVGHDWAALGRVALFLPGSVALTAHVFVFNDWAGRRSDINDPRRVTRLFDRCGINSREVVGLAVGLLVVATLILAAVSASAVFLGASIAALSLLYSGSSSWGKGRPIVASLLHLVGGTLHFLLGYAVGGTVDARGVAIAAFFGLVFAGGHLNQEVRDYDADRRNGIRTNAVGFGCRPAFLASLLVFTGAYGLLAFLVSLEILPRPLIWCTLFWPYHLACALRALRGGLGFEAANWMQRRYRLLFAVLGLAMLLTAPAVTEFARRVYERANGRSAIHAERFEPLFSRT